MPARAQTPPQPSLVMTGLGVVSPFGVGAQAFATGLKAGRPAFRPVSLFTLEHPAMTLAAWVDPFKPGDLLGKGLRTMDRTSLLVLAALAADLKQPLEAFGREQLGLVLGTGFGSLHAICQFDRVRLKEGPSDVDPAQFPNTVFNCPASQGNIRFGITGLTSTLTTGYTSGLDALSYARSAIRWGRADAVVAGGAEELCEELCAAYIFDGAMSGSGRCLPFGAGRDGLLPGEGCAMVLVEREQAARSAGRAVLARLGGLAQACSTTPRLELDEAAQTLQQTIEEALAEAKVAPSEVGVIFAGANGVKELDAIEEVALAAVFGANSPPVAAVKSLVGEGYGAGAALQLAAAVLALAEGFIPGTPSGPLAPGCRLAVAAETRARKLSSALVTSVDPRGRMACAVLTR